MPYRQAHWYLLMLFPLSTLAFWKEYVSKISSAPVEFHAHAITGMLWIGLLAGQSWLIHHGRRDLHRQFGIASLAVFPLFLATGAGISIVMAQEFVRRVTQLGVIYSPRFALADAVWVGGFAYCYYEALRQRRKVYPHSRYMLATVLFLLPPIITRLRHLVPPLDIGRPGDFWKVGLDDELATALSAAIAFFLAWRTPKHGRPFAEAGIIIVISGVLFQTVGSMPSWHNLYAHVASVPVSASVLGAGLGGIIVAYAGWLAGKRPAAGVEILRA